MRISLPPIRIFICNKGMSLILIIAITLKGNKFKSFVCLVAVDVVCCLPENNTPKIVVSSLGIHGQWSEGCHHVTCPGTFTPY